MSPVLVSTYQIFITALLVMLFIAFWSKTMIISKLIVVESKLDRVLNEHSQLHAFSIDKLSKVKKDLKVHMDADLKFQKEFCACPECMRLNKDKNTKTVGE